MSFDTLFKKCSVFIFFSILELCINFVSFDKLIHSNERHMSFPFLEYMVALKRAGLLLVSVLKFEHFFLPSWAFLLPLCRFVACCLVYGLLTLPTFTLLSLFMDWLTMSNSFNDFSFSSAGKVFPTSVVAWLAALVAIFCNDVTFCSNR